ncbi:MAG: NAD(P)-dependent oxidoreductase [Candidatus Lokiarchaeota archaeon]|nr:NAD(P)-dependent oxidoreductase [Candidatus Lokiarchaeota archaeon]
MLRSQPIDYLESINFNILGMKVLLTGAFGNVGLSTLKVLVEKDYNVRVFEIYNKKNRRIAKKFKNRIEIIWGDLRNKEEVNKAVHSQDIIIHLAAIIPPLADTNPRLAESVNIGGTQNILDAMKNLKQKPKLLFTSSVAVYGDRRYNPMIEVTDPIAPSRGDYYAITKISAENLIRESGLDFAIFRLTYITSIDKLNMDPLMFHMPLDTSIEICDTKDIGLALVNAIECDEVWGETFNLAGGKQCRITYKEYLNDMMEIFGLGRNFLPEEGFAEKDFHCGFMNTDKSQSILKYQKHTLEDYYAEVKRKIGPKKHFMSAIKWMIRLNLLKRSESYRRHKFFRKKAGAFTVSENKLIRKILAANFNRIELLEKKIETLEDLTANFIERKKEVPVVKQVQSA